MRVVYPLLALLAYAFFLVSLGAGFLAVTLVPIAVALLAAALVAGGQIGAFLRLLEAFFRLTIGAVRVGGSLLSDLLEGSFGGDPEPTRVVGAYGREALPEVFRLVDEVAAELRTRGVEKVLVTHDASCAAIELRRPGLLPRGRRRVLLLGLPFVYALSLDEMRAVIAHELAHFALRHGRALRTSWRFLERVERQILRMQEGDFWPLNPVYWAVRSSHAVLAAIHHPWSRLRELEADRRAARAFGANHCASGFRKLRDSLPALQMTQDVVVGWCRANGRAPLHLGEAAARVSGALPPLLRKRLAVRAEGDVRDLTDRTHPPIALRIASLRGVPDRPVRHGELAARYLPDLRNLEAHLTRVALRIEEQSATKQIAAEVLAHLSGKPAEA